MDHDETNRCDTLRIIDAAANRAREGLRVVEDFTRFALDDPYLTRLLKECRHQITESLKIIEPIEFLSARDTVQDVGTGIRTTSEIERHQTADVVQANIKRAQEATRTLEEFVKTLSTKAAEQLSQLRYQLYTLEKAIILTQVNQDRFDGRWLYLLLTKALCRRSWETVLDEALSEGVGVVQLREKTMPDRQFLEYAARVRRQTNKAGARLIINDRPDLAVLANADGVHVGQEEFSVREARRIVGPDGLVGVSTHSIQQARQAVLDGADYLGVGPVFPSTTKNFTEFAGLEFVRQVAQEISLPWFAIGGINANNIQRVLEVGAHRVAVSSAICRADEPKTAASQLWQRIEQRRTAAADDA